jgi:mannose-1-phosphate guanylyltransferase/mannose-1-phosphate guanylyltransferase/mannose-6-phosphate isomerase
MEGLSNYERDVRPWGEFERFTLNEKTTVKIITVKPGEAFSLQSHKRRGEFWRIISGGGTITLDKEQRSIRAGDNFFSPIGHEHRMEGGPEGLQFLEIAFGEFDEADITRLEDKYERT